MSRFFTWLLPPGPNSTFAPDIDRLYYIVLIITGIAFVIVDFDTRWPLSLPPNSTLGHF